MLDLVVAMPQIESGDADEARTSRRGFGRGVLPCGEKENDVDRCEKGRRADEPQVAQKRGEAEKQHGAADDIRDAVIDDIERRPPVGEEAEPGQEGAKQDADDSEHS
jgi:hypothetical protein